MNHCRLFSEHRMKIASMEDSFPRGTVIGKQVCGPPLSEELAHSRNQHRPMILRYAVCGDCGDCGDCSVFHRTVAFDVQEVEPGLWR
jgi:hypothetical protein